MKANVQKSLQDWVAEIGQLDFPVYEATHLSLGALEHDANVSGASIAAIVLPDPSMVLKSMRMVNSGRSQRFAQPVLTVEHAVMMTGMAASFNKLLACPVLDLKEIPAGYLATVARATHAGMQARDWAMQRYDMNVEEVYIAALLQEAGALALWWLAPDRMIEVQRAGGDRDTAEREILGFSVDDLTLALVTNWNLPPLIASALRPEDTEAHPRARLVALAKRLARDVERGWYGEVVAGDIAAVADTLRITEDDATARIHRVATETARLRDFPGLTHAATWLPMLPGEWPHEDTATEKSAGNRLSPFEVAMTEISAHLDGTLNLNDLMKLVLKGMRDGIGLRRVVFALLSQDRAQLRARFVVGAAENSPLRQFQFDMRKPALFSKMMGKQQAFWLNNETRAKVQALLDEETERITRADQFFVMTVAVHDKVIGLFYADTQVDADHQTAGAHPPLSAGAYEQFKQLCTQASTGMAHLARS